LSSDALRPSSAAPPTVHPPSVLPIRPGVGPSASAVVPRVRALAPRREPPVYVCCSVPRIFILLDSCARRLFFISGASGASAKSSRPKPPRPPGILRTPTRQYTRGRRLSCPSPGTPRENCAYVPARTQTRAAPFQSCAHVRLPCAGAPWPSRAARTSCAPLALPEAAAYPLTPRRARRSTPHQHTCAFLRPVQALQTASGIS